MAYVRTAQIGPNELRLRYEMTDEALKDSVFQVYRNLHRKGYSLMLRNCAIPGYESLRGRVVAHTQRILLDRIVGFAISETRRQRVIQTGVKNVHAFIVARLSLGPERSRVDMAPITYNPYTRPDFYWKLSGAVLLPAFLDQILCSPDGVFACHKPVALSTDERYNGERSSP